MALGKTAKFYRDNPESRKKHQETSKKWNQSDEGKAYKKEKNATPEETRKRKVRKEARRITGAKKGETVDHIIPLSKGGTNSKRNLRKVSPNTNFTKNKK